MTRAQRTKWIIKPILFLASLGPLVILVVNFLTDNLSANPLDDITDETGTWTLRLIVVTLCMTPLRRLTGWIEFTQLRRMFGLFAFFYGCLHFLTYLYFDKFFEWEEILIDLPKRPFILVGFATLMTMVPLALTSTNRMAKWLGGKRWTKLHRLVYLTAIGGTIHYLWLVKADIQRPLTYGAIFAVLLGYRLWYSLASKLTSLKTKSSHLLQQEIKETTP
ncbi:MAG TPA: protein-methionine-sulfoxide reductase heme-binding subunit MsrQ [Bacteroidota bacterium]|nr:protein-methionine-sulfoxide reductase heme-binding subunit MsrQ [Bacteroidota bacterium]